MTEVIAWKPQKFQVTWVSGDELREIQTQKTLYKAKQWEIQKYISDRVKEIEKIESKVDGWIRQYETMHKETMTDEKIDLTKIPENIDISKISELLFPTNEWAIAQMTAHVVKGSTNEAVDKENAKLDALKRQWEKEYALKENPDHELLDYA